VAFDALLGGGIPGVNRRAKGNDYEKLRLSHRGSTAVDDGEIIEPIQEGWSQFK
jgi:hypothetical protein